MSDKVDALRYGLSYYIPYKSKPVYDLPKLAEDLPSPKWEYFRIHEQELQAAFDAYYTLDLYRWYGWEHYGIPKGQMNNYILYNAFGSNLGTYSSEEAAVKAAENMAQANKGQTYYVHKSVAITKSYVAPAPAITTRL